MNKVIMCGRITKDLELRYVGNENLAMLKFSIAVDRKFQKKGEERKVDFFNCICFRSQAEFMAKHMQKGQRVLVEGNLQNSTWDDKEGNKRYSTDIMIESVYFADGKKEGQGSTNNVSNEMLPGYTEADIPGADDLPF